MTFPEILAACIMLYGAWWLAFSREISPEKKTGLVAIVAFVCVALFGGGRK